MLELTTLCKLIPSTLICRVMIVLPPDHWLLSVYIYAYTNVCACLAIYSYIHKLFAKLLNKYNLCRMSVQSLKQSVTELQIWLDQCQDSLDDTNTSTSDPLVLTQLALKYKVCDTIMLHTYMTYTRYIIIYCLKWSRSKVRHSLKVV